MPGALLVGAANRSWLEVIIGTALLATLVTTTLMRTRRSVVVGPRRWPKQPEIPQHRCEVAAPAMLVYAQATNWNQRSFAATLQLIFSTTSATCVITKVGLSAAPIPGLPPLSAIGLVVAMVPLEILLAGLVVMSGEVGQSGVGGGGAAGCCGGGGDC